MRRTHIAVATAIVLGIATTAAAGSDPVMAVAHHSTYAQIILWETTDDGDAGETLAGLVTCPEGGFVAKLVRQIRKLSPCATAGFLYAYPSWAGEPWRAANTQVVQSDLEVDDTGRLWSTTHLRYVPAAVAEHPDAAAIADAFAVQIQDPRPGPDGNPVNYHLTIHADDLLVQPGGLAALALGVGPAPA